MTDTDYKDLDILLDKLAVELGCRYCLIPNHVADGSYLAIYDADGNIKGNFNAINIKDCVRKIKDTTINHIK